MSTASYHRPHAATTVNSRGQQFQERIEDSNTIEVKNLGQISALLSIMSLTSAQRSALHKYFASTIQALQVSYTCPHCAQKFTLWESMGRGECRNHIGRFERDTWTCCNRTTLIAEASPSRPFESPATITGCTRTDHLVPGETASVTPNQIDMVHNILSDGRLTQDFRSRYVYDQLLPPRLGTTSVITIPYLLYMLLPDRTERRVQKVILSNLRSLQDSHNQLLNATEAHPLGKNGAVLIGLGNDQAIDPLDIQVCLARTLYRYNDD